MGIKPIVMIFTIKLLNSALNLLEELFPFIDDCNNRNLHSRGGRNYYVWSMK